ncbi:hypothetical protein [Planococcus sp. CAU13]|uniref:hypothetical protein n=1 Tax=Planococcus sp. CAU13 TaxID=1541197 RepID=UPI0005300B93|nr:hypothetical protein [Planococcus sp. CAU13]
MGFIIAFIVVMTILSFVYDRHSAEQSKFRKTRSSDSNGSFHYYGDYSSGSDGGGDCGGGGGGGD